MYVYLHDCAYVSDTPRCTPVCSCSACSDLRARLEVAVNKVVSLQQQCHDQQQLQQHADDTDYASDAEDVSH